MCGDFLLLLQGVTGIVYIPVRHGLCVDKYKSRYFTKLPNVEGGSFL